MKKTDGKFKVFSFVWKDAFNTSNWGYEILLENTPKGSNLLVLSDGAPTTIVIDDENELLDELMKCNITSWDDNIYECICEDGYRWGLFVAWDNQEVRAWGDNGYPCEFIAFLEVLHGKFGVPNAEIDSQKGFDLKTEIKHTKIMKNGRQKKILAKGTIGDF
jgi:hypothetical protein